jgi:predicted secreted protein
MAISGRKIRISRDGAAVVGARSDTLTISMEPVDVTDKDSNGWRTLLGDVSTRSLDAEVSGVIKDATLIGQAMAANNLIIDAGEVEIDGIATFTGDWFISNVSVTGEQADAVLFTGTLQGAGIIAVGIAPYNTVLPAVTGTPTNGQTLTRTLGTWAGDATITYATQWQQSPTADPNDPRWTDISGATGATRVLGAGQVGAYVRARVTATNSVGSTVAFSNIVGPVAA